jgi:uncharacterized Zn finger protein
MDLTERLKRLTEDEIEELCGERIIFRAEDYLDNVSNLRIERNELHSSVQGTMPRPYKVKISYKNDAFIPICSCPAEMDFCKHVAATLMVAKGRNVAKIKKFEVSSEDIASYVSELGREDLVALVNEYAGRFNEIRKELSLKMAKKRHGRIDIKEYVDEINHAVSGFVDYYQMHDFLDDLERIYESVEKVAREFPEEASSILERFIRKCIDHYENCDDSDGIYGEFIERLMGLHANTLSKFKCDQKKLVDWVIYHWENNDYGLGDEVLNVYSKALREDGLNVLKDYFLPKFKSLDKSITQKSRWDTKYRYSSIKELLLKVYDLLGDDESFFNLAESKMLEADDYIILARKLVKLGRIDEAIEKCEQGLRKDNDDKELLGILVELYRQKNHHKKELNAMERLFQLEPGDDLFKNIKRLAERIGEWNECKERMINVLRAKGYHGMLSALYMEDKNYDSLIKLAYDKKCDRESRERIAKFLVQEHPAESINLYRMVISEAIMEMENHAYRKAARLLANLRKLYLAEDKRHEWICYIEEIKKEHKTKRNFMGELMRAGLVQK